MIAEAERILISEAEIQAKVRELGAEISAFYGDKPILALGILKGAIVFMSDLIRHISCPLEMDFMAVSSYGSSTESSGVVRILKDLDGSIEGKHVLIIEDIIDSGLTLNYLVENLKSRGPASLKIVTLLNKPSRRKVNIQADFNGFTIPDEFVVGYGLDFAERYRNLPYICVLKPEAYQK